MPFYDLQPSIEIINQKQLIGLHRIMSLNNDATFELWHAFMPRLKEILKTSNNNLISMQLYDPSVTKGTFTPDTPFEKWAAVEVDDIKLIPEGMQSYRVPGGMYATFKYQGAANEAQDAIRYIFEQWLPNSEYRLDDRPHLTVMGERYKGNDPDSEEEFRIPVIQK